MFFFKKKTLISYCYLVISHNSVFELYFSYGDFSSYTRQKKHKTYILKPEVGCQGKGIWVTRNPREIKPHEHMLCQQYLSKVSARCKLKQLLKYYNICITFLTVARLAKMPISTFNKILIWHTICMTVCAFSLLFSIKINEWKSWF